MPQSDEIVFKMNTFKSTFKFNLPLFLVMIVVIFEYGVSANLLEHLHEAAEWANFKRDHGKNYGNIMEEIKRRNIFARTLAHINTHNSNPANTFLMGINEFSDLEPTEFLGKISSNVTFPQLAPIPFDGLQETNLRRRKRNTYTYQYINYKDLGQITSAKNQKTCGCPYAFVGVAALESLAIRKWGLNKTKVDFSEQQILDCTFYLYRDRTFNMGCDGGHSYFVFQYSKSHAILSESLYPYQAAPFMCNSLVQLPATGQILVTDFHYVSVESENHLAYLLWTFGPISVSMAAGSNAFKNYKAGIISRIQESSVGINHQMLLIGVGRTSDGMEYWLFKNSWGSGWGEEGYIRLRKGINICGITNQGVSYVV